MYLSAMSSNQPGLKILSTKFVCLMPRTSLSRLQSGGDVRDENINDPDVKELVNELQSEKSKKIR